MTRSLPKAATAITLALTLAQPAPLFAQTADCSADPAAQGCVMPEAEAAQPEPQAPEPAAPQPEAAPADAPTTEPAPSQAVPAEAPPVAEPASEAPPEAAPPEAAPPEPAPPEPAQAAPEAAAAADAAPSAEAPPLAGEPSPADMPAAEPPAVEPVAAEPAPVAEPAAPAAEPPATAPSAEPEASAPPAAATDASADTGAGGTSPDTPEVPLPDVAPVPTEAERQVVDSMMENPEVAAAVETLAQALAPATEEAPADAALAAAAAALAGTAAPEAADVVTQTLDAGQTRSATQDFASTVSTAVPASAAVAADKGMSDLEKAGLVALGAVAVGMLINNSRVVANSGDRVVVDKGDGNLAVWKDDNAILRTPGVVETTERYADGSTMTTLDRPDGSRIVTVRDATGRVLGRTRVNPDGTRVAIIDDSRAAAPVEVSKLPRPRLPDLRFAANSDPALIRAMLDQAEQRDLGRSFSLDQVRNIREVRALAPEIAADPITFASGSSAIRPEEASKLLQIGQLMKDMIAENPAELFLIEGHTDATGGAAMNLALSDRRAETVALALTEFFGVPPENMVVQGYGERYLKVPVATDEPANRRVALRRITWLVDG